MAGFIPTRAGKISVRSLGIALNAVHPHSRGENLFVSSSYMRCPGSSPLARGKSAQLQRETECSGFIPTRAGKIKCLNWVEERP